MPGSSPHSIEHPFVSHYVVSYTEDEQERLNWQNQFLTKTVCEGKLISAPTTLDPGDEVLESATGTGIWLLSVAREVHPHVSLTGIDINPQFFPTQHSPNITFSVHSVTNLPDSWTGRFKLANQRLLVGALTFEQWGVALSELYRVLKPGGWVQLLETSPETTAYSGPNMKRLMDVSVALYASKGLVSDLNETINQRLEHAGFINVHKRIVGLPRMDAQDLDSEHEGHKRVVMAFGPAVKQSLLGTGMFESEDDLNGVMEGMHKEWDTPSQCLWRWTVAYAQKPEV
ncbi:S-adenosyl-L-methionine-dependent methyltransferase [Rhodocollybia butyracea]|uniref:S-adenosyl-L-methionine-dependent methyltransferase n=1 Tax=Rhodocollybia butyracea TaxID=206335 RepID=A0A9P5PZ66_9AGAR|nr:S-adenosyl-L-methionine-dependent methyltransferase [Rhodocollybia butyracea]